MSASAAATVANAARKTTNFANQVFEKFYAQTSFFANFKKAWLFKTVETARFDVIKEPLGFVKILQFVSEMFAYFNFI